MSAYRTVRLYCDGRDPATEQNPRGTHCGQGYVPPGDCDPWPGNSIPGMRKAAAEDGWTHVPYPGNRRLGGTLDRDYCPEHKPQENQQ